MKKTISVDSTFNNMRIDRFIRNQIQYTQIYQSLKRVFKDRDFHKYAIKKRPNIKEIYKIDKWAREKTKEIIGFK